MDPDSAVRADAAVRRAAVCTPAVGVQHALDSRAQTVSGLSYRRSLRTDAVHDSGRGQRRVHLHGRLPQRTPAAAARLSAIEPVCHCHGGLRQFRQPFVAVSVLGTDQPAVFPAGRLQPRRRRQPQIGPTGHADHRRRRAGAARRLGHFGATGRQLAHQRHRGATAPYARQPEFLLGHRPHHGRRLYQKRPVSFPLLATQCHVGSHARFGLPALGHHGQAGRVPAGAAGCRHGRLALVANQPASGGLLHRRLGHAAGTTRI